MSDSPLVSVVMPCLNEEETVGLCVEMALKTLKKAKIDGEVVICDNGSIDNSIKLAQKAGARVVLEKRKGYGSAYLRGIKEAKGEIIVIGDSDGTYDFSEIPSLLKKFGEGYDLVLGARLSGRIEKGAMPFLNRFFGTPVLNFFLKIFYGLSLSDSQSGMRIFSKKTFEKLKLKTLGMEFASEMLIRAAQNGLKIGETPISYKKRIAPSKLSRFRDAWRHFRFMLLFAPTYLFLIPGSFFMIVGVLGLLALSRGPLWLFGRFLDFHSMILASLLTLVGYQVIMLGIYAKVFSWVCGFTGGELIISAVLKYFRLEKGIGVGLGVAFMGAAVGAIAFIHWAQTGFGSLSAIRPAILSMTLFVLGIQIIFSSFFLSILGLERRQ